MFEGLSNPRHEVFGNEGLLEKAGEVVGLKIDGRPLLGVAAREHDANVGSKLAKFSDDFFAGEPGHGAIEENGIDRARILCERVDTGSAVHGGDGFEAATLERFPRQFENRFVVVNDQDGTLPLPVQGFLDGYGVIFGVLPLALVVALTGLEILIAFLQAYVFAILTCLYINDAIHLH